MDNQKKMLKLLDYLRQVGNLRQKLVKNLQNEVWCLEFASVPLDPKRIHLYSPEDELPPGAPEGLIFEVEKPEFTPCPELPFDLIGWVRTPDWKNFEVTEIEVRDERSRRDPRLGEITERFVDSGVRLAAFEDWKRHRSLWRSGELVKSRTQKLFMSLYGLYDKLRQDPEGLELVVGNACFLNGLDTEIEHPMLMKKVRLLYDKRGKMQVVDGESATELYTELFQDLPGIKGEGVREFAAWMDEKGIHPLSGNLKEFFESTAPILTPNCRWAAQRFELLPTDWYLVYPRPCLYLRRHNAGIAKAVADIAAQIEQGGEIPQAMLEIVDPEFKPTKVVLPESEGDQLLSDARGEAADILLTKPANAEQLIIAREIEQAPAVVVQGPPGTGKTHTIANLLGHFLAQGQHVLVTSATSKALSVLKDKLPEGLQNLCVSLLEGARQDMEKSVAGICEMMSRQSAGEMRQRADELSKRREEVLKKLGRKRRTLEEVRQLEAKRDYFNLGGKAWSLSRMADYLHIHEDLEGRLPLPLVQGKDFPLEKNELEELYLLNGEFDAESLCELREELPDVFSLLPPARAGELLEREQRFIKNEKELLEALPQAVIDHKEEILCEGHRVVGEDLVPDFLKQAQIYLDSLDLKRFSIPWARAAVLAGSQGGARREVWEMLGRDIERVQQLKSQYIKLFFGHDFKYLLDRPLDKDLIQNLAELAEIFDASGKLPWWMKLRRPELTKVQQGFVIDGKPLGSRLDCQMAMQYVSLHEARAQLSREWEQLLVPLGMDSYADMAAGEEDLDDLCQARWQEFKSLLDWREETLMEIRRQCEQAGIIWENICVKGDFLTPASALDKELNWLQEDLPRWLKLVHLSYVERRSDRALDKLWDVLQEATGKVSEELRKAVTKGDSALYEEAYERLRHYQEVKPRYRRRQELLGKLSASAPHWAEQLENQVGLKLEAPQEAVAAWTYEQLKMEMAGVPKVNVARIAAEAKDLTAELQEVTTQLAEALAWYQLLEKVEGTGLQASLMGWSKAVKKLGKGTGKYAARHLREARACMLEAQRAVPAWIMPLSRVWQNLPADAPKFDLIIIDEASQADILSLPLLYFAKRVIIVGDDQQVSPADIGVQAEDILSLQSATIEGIIDHASLYTMDTSLYDLAQMHFQARLLSEHFRSVPEIIGYSNKLCYEGRIRPLREGVSSPFMPLIDWQVAGEREEGTKRNTCEAEEIVSLLAACLEQPEYEGKTFGAISLLGEEQSRLIRELAAEKLGITALENCGFIAGNPAQFQGDERDIIFLSLVDSSEGEEQLRLLGEGRGADNVKRYNVAVSRSRDQLWAVHSMPLESLKSNDLRRGLLEYIRENAATKPQENARELSSLETAVCRALELAGFEVHTNWQTGSGQLGLVVAGQGRLAAIDCQGEHWYSGAEEIMEEQRQQAVLMRLGWTFLRVRGSEWYAAPDKVLARLQGYLQAMGIEPMAGEKEPTAALRLELMQRVTERAEAIRASWQQTLEE